MNKEANWYGLNMLPIYAEIIDSQLEASLQQRNNLLNTQTRPQGRDGLILDHIIKRHREQNADNWVFFEQCTKWRNENPSGLSAPELAP